MFDIAICQSRCVVLIRFSGMLLETDLIALEATARRTPQAALFDCIFDFSRVEKAELATDFISRRGDLPHAFQHRRRIYVVPQPDLKLLMRLYAAYQASKGWREPAIIDDLNEAFARLGLAESDFLAVNAATSPRTESSFRPLERVG
jgi:hypothetical protein